MEFSEMLIEEHKPIRRALDVLEAMRAKVERGDSTDRHDVNALLIFLHYFADACHQAKEESILFPVLERVKKRAPSMELEGLLEEHNQERSLIEQTQITLFTEEHREFIQNVRKLIDLLSGHMVKEEQVLFPLAEQILTREEAAQLGVRMEESDAKFGFTQRKLLLQMLEHLEKVYVIPKAA